MEQACLKIKFEIASFGGFICKATFLEKREKKIDEKREKEGDRQADKERWAEVDNRKLQFDK